MWPWRPRRLEIGPRTFLYGFDCTLFTSDFCLQPSDCFTFYYCRQLKYPRLWKDKPSFRFRNGKSCRLIWYYSITYNFSNLGENTNFVMKNVHYYNKKLSVSCDFTVPLRDIYFYLTRYFDVQDDAFRSRQFYSFFAAVIIEALRAGNFLL